MAIACSLQSLASENNDVCGVLITNNCSECDLPGAKGSKTKHIAALTLQYALFLGMERVFDTFPFNCLFVLIYLFGMSL